MKEMRNNQPTQGCKGQMLQWEKEKKGKKKMKKKKKTKTKKKKRVGHLLYTCGELYSKYRHLYNKKKAMSL